jgi:hypothetical protein
MTAASFLRDFWNRGYGPFFLGTAAVVAIGLHWAGDKLTLMVSDLSSKF